MKSQSYTYNAGSASKIHFDQIMQPQVAYAVVCVAETNLNKVKQAEPISLSLPS